ncbi:hypothetical protein EUGRSUZ_L03159 [Eucalyptus grandis]|uniref:F-box domain-containing protein n=1 Tax=Eucalyptus grandis TaxID=71139 RepID=A0AAD9T8L3_EUCGR|nr:hypothetical protein EUGRSUZ_L03159 [Eucalyptus grandis]
MMRLENNLPHEIVLEILKRLLLEILKRLPVKPLMRFKCVSKLWLCTIEDLDFMALHLKHLALSGTMSEIEVPFISSMGYYGVVGSCNRLIYFVEANAEDRNQRIFLWNLFTRKHKAILSSLLDYPFVYMIAAHMVEIYLVTMVDSMVFP